MTSTFANDLRLNEMATGDQSGSWGTVTNKNLELIGDALGFGTEATFNQDQDKTTTVLDGDPDPARAMYFKVTSTVSGGLTATRKLTIAPDTINRLMFIENATTGGESITIKQGSGSGAAVTIPNGYTKAVILSGSGSGSIVLDAFASLSVDDLLVDDDLTVTGLATVTGGALLNGTTPTLTIGDAGAEDAKIVFDGNAADYHVGLDDSEDALQIGLGAALGTTPRITIRGTEVAVNDLGIDLNFRVESSNTAHLLFADGGEDVVGIGTPTPVPSAAAYKRAALHIHQEQGGSTGSQIHMTNDATGAAAGNGMFIAMWQDDDVYFTNQESDGNIKFATGGNNNVLVLDAAGAATFSSTVTADGGIDVDNFHIDGTTVALSSGNLTIDAEAGDIVLDAHGNDFILKSGATGIVLVAGDNTSGDFFMRVETADKNFLINGTDGSTAITALNLDMADAGDATFNRNIGLGASDVSIDTRLHIDACPDGKVITLEQSGRKSAIGTFFSPGSTLSRLDFFLSDGNQNGGNNNRMSILSSGDVQVKTGNLVVGTAGKGIDFSAYGAGDDIDNNLLNDYEEGTFTPVYVATGTAFGAITHDTQSGYYTKIGNVVNFSLVLRTDAFTLGSGSGSVQINGLPFPAAGIDTFPIAINAQSGWTNYMPFGGWVSSTVITLTNNAGGSDRTGYRTIPVANMTDGLDKNRIYLTGTYITNA